MDAAVSALYETVLDPSHWTVAMRELASLFSASSALLFEYDFAAREVLSANPFNLDPLTQQAYSDHFHLLDPGREIAATAPVGQWLSDEELLDVRSRIHQEYVQDFALRFNIGRVAGCKVLGDDAYCQYLSFSRPPGAERFGEVSRLQFLTLRPHFQRIRRMQARVGSLNEAESLWQYALDRISAAILIVDRARTVHMANAQALRQSAPGASISVRNNVLCCDSPLHDERLARLVCGACATAIGGTLRVPRPDAKTDLLVMVIPIPPSHRMARVRSEPLAMVVIADPEADHLPLEIYRSMFSLTAAEGALLAALARGMPVSQWVQERGISMATVRSQLHALFEKTGVDSQARLVALAKSILPIRGD